MWVVPTAFDMASKDSGKRFSLANTYFAFIQRRHKSDRLLLNLSLFAVIASVLFLIYTVNDLYTTTVPISGGSITEGIVGTPRFVNPVLAINQADHDMVALIYSGLLKQDEHGNLVPDVAQSVTVSDDGKTYHVELKKGVHFQDGMEMTTKDFAYTIGLIQNPDLKSPLRGNWDGVQVHVINDYEMDIVLPEAYASFMENLTVGILPHNLWASLPVEQIPFSQNNSEPIGSGPYKISNVVHSKSGIITSYTLSAYSDNRYNPNIDSLTFNFYETDSDILKALANKTIESTASLTPDELTKIDTDQYNIIQAPLPRTFAIYFNENKSAALRDLSARKALDVAIDKQALVDKVLYGYGIPSDSPVPPGFLPVESTSSTSTQNSVGTSTQNSATTTSRIDQAAAILRDGGWQKTASGTWQKSIDKNMVTLSVSIDTANTPLFDQTANYISDVWKSLGVQVNVTEFEQSDLVQSAIRPRDFEALLYGADIGRQIDLYPFWHSSQKDDPGLNIAQYTNIDVDALLEKAHSSTSTELRAQDIARAASIIESEHPAVFLFVPTFGYVFNKDITVAPLNKIGSPSDRFANIAQWNIKSNKLWPIFSNKKQ